MERCRRPLAGAILLALVAAAPVSAQRLLRISLENSESHVQTRMVRLFTERLRKTAPALFTIEIATGASLFRDIDVVQALALGKIEMAAPGLWQLDRFASDAAAFMLPSVYGQEREVLERLADGALGSRIVASLEAAQGIVVLGRWIELGSTCLFSFRAPIRSAADLQGKRIRVAGGRANEERLRALGADPIAIPLADLVSFIQRSLVDAMLSSYETIDSAALDASGVRYAYDDRQYFAFYVPLVGKRFWQGLDESSREALREAWNSIVDEARDEAGRAQEQAAARLRARGLSVVSPGKEELAATRRRLIAEEAAIARRLAISEDVLALLKSSLPP